jgi:hypothetical protein
MPQQGERIRALNDKLRTSGHGGEIVITRGIQALPPSTVVAAITSIQAFHEFTCATIRIRNMTSAC